MGANMTCMDTKWSLKGDWVVGREEGGWVGHLDHDADELGGLPCGWGLLDSVATFSCDAISLKGTL